MKLDDVVAVVTGGASGIGAGVAEYLLEKGAKGVAILDLNGEAGQPLADRLGARAIFVQTDVTDLGSVEAACAASEAAFGPITLVVNSAGVTLPAKLIGRKGPIDMTKFDLCVKINLYGSLHVIRSAVPSMLKATPNEDGERGLVINVSSGAAYEGQVGQVAYSAAKGAIVGMTFPLMRELAPDGIRVVAVAPGAFDTAIYATMDPAVKRGIEDTFLFPRRMGTAREFALFVEELIRNPIHNGRTYRFDAGNILMP